MQTRAWLSLSAIFFVCSCAVIAETPSSLPSAAEAGKELTAKAGGDSTSLVDSDGDGLSDEFEVGAGRYEVIAGSFTWHGAKADAEKRGGHLATVTSEAEWRAILSLVGPDLSRHETWLGATDEEIEGAWRWVTGEPWSFSNWGAGEPNNSGDEDYLEIIPRDASWNDIPTRGAENYTIHYLFERGYFTDPKKADSDGDGFSDGIEYEAGSIPNDPKSRPLPRITT